MKKKIIVLLLGMPAIVNILSFGQEIRISVANVCLNMQLPD